MFFTLSCLDELKEAVARATGNSELDTIRLLFKGALSPFISLSLFFFFIGLSLLLLLLLLLLRWSLVIYILF